MAPESLVITGLPRFDELVRKANGHRGEAGAVESPGRVLYMPTWRDWLPRQTAGFRASRFYQQVRGFLQNPELQACLAQHGAILDVHLHSIMEPYRDLMSGELESLNVRFLPPGLKLQDALARSRLLITDYSSVAWDFLYLDKPVLFYQFDVEEFTEHWDAYVDLGDLFGPVVHSAPDVAAAVRRFVEADFECGEYRAKMTYWQGKAFQYRDRGNCERVVQAILARLEGR